MKMVKKRVAELEGAQLDAMVEVAEGGTIRARPDGTYQGKGDSFVPWYSIPRYSTEWGKGGPIIEREGIELFPDCVTDSRYSAPDVWLARKLGWKGVDVIGQTALIAAMRALVAAKLGDEVEIPE